MANLSNAFGLTGVAPSGGGGGGQVGNTAYQQISPTSDPTFARLLEQIQNITPTALPGIESIVGGGMNSPLLQLVLGPMLQRLQAPQAQARQNLTEQTRAAGGLRGSTYGADMNKLVQNQALQQNDLMSQVLQHVLGTLVSGSLQSQQNQMLPGRSLTDLLRTIVPQTITGATGGGGGGGGGVLASSGFSGGSPSVSPEDRDAQLRGFPSAEAMRFQQMLGASSPRAAAAPGPLSSAASAPYTPYLSPLDSGGGGWYDLGGGTQYLNSPATATPTSNLTYPAPTPEWNPTTGAYQGGYQPLNDYEQSFF